MEGVNAYIVHDFKTAHEYFMRATDVSIMPQMGTIDSVMSYYAGVVSLLESVSDNDNAIKYLSLCLDNSYYGNDANDPGSIYSMLAKAYQTKGDSITQEQLLMTGFAKFPKSQSVLIELINIKLNAGKDPLEVIPFLNQAQANEPGNATLYFAEATLYEKLKMIDSAENIYKRTIIIDPENFNAYYNLGALYFNRGVELNKERMEIKKDFNKIKALKVLEDAEFKRALEPFHKAHELNPTDKYALENIKTIYFRFRDDSPEMMDNFTKFDEEYKKLTGQ
jgi:tetratricopeptide (TPR) repeat protein